MVVAVALLVEHHLLGLRINVHHLPKQDLDVGGLAHHLPQGGGHIRFRNQPRSHLIKKGLEEVEVALVDQGDSHWLACQGMTGLQTGKPPSHDHHMGPSAHGLNRRIQFQKEAFHRP